MTRRWVIGSLSVLFVACGGNDAAKPSPDAPPVMPDAAPDAAPDAPTDDDGDGTPAPLDCDDHDPVVYPGAPELCDFRSTSCGTRSEDGTAAFFPRTGAPRDVTALVQEGTATVPASLDFDEEGTLNLCAGSFFVSILSEANSLAVHGAGSTRTALSGGQISRVITLVPDDAVLDVAGVTLREGISDSGGAIAGDGRLTVTDVKFLENRADANTPEGLGGAVYWIGTATLSDTVFTSNAATRFGGAITVFGNLTLRNSQLSSNISEGGGAVSAIDGTVTLDTVELEDNRALVQAGAVFLQDAISTLRGVTLSTNRAASDVAGGTAVAGAVLLLGGQATIEDATLKGNSSSQGGGALTVNGGDATIRRTTFDANESFHFAGSVPSLVNGFGGAIEVLDAKLRVEDSSITRNKGTWGFGVFVETISGGNVVDFVNTVFSANSNVFGQASSASLEYWSATATQSIPVDGTVAFHCDDRGCTASGAPLTPIQRRARPGSPAILRITPPAPGAASRARRHAPTTMPGATRG